MDGTTRVYERGKARIHISSWVPCTPLKHNSTPVAASVTQPNQEADAAGSCYLLDAQLHVLDAECWTSKCASPQALLSEYAHDRISESSIMPDGPGTSCADTYDLKQCTVVRGGISVPLPLHCDLNEVPGVIPDEDSLAGHVSVTPVLHCDLNEIPEIVADGDVSADRISEVVPFTPFHNREVEKEALIDGIISSGYIDVNMDEITILRGKGADNANLNKDKLQTGFCLPAHSTAAEQKQNVHKKMMKLQTPQQKPKRKKHKPKVLVDGYKPRARKKRSSSTFIRVEKHLTNKKKYMRLNRSLASHSKIDPDVTEQMTIQSTRKSTRRLLDFDSKGLVIDDWYPSKPEDVNHFYNNGEGRGEKRGYSSMISNSINIHNIEYNSHLAASGSNLPFIPFLEISKRRRTTKGRSSLSSIKCWLSTAKFLAEPGVMKGCLEEIQRSKCPLPQAKRSKSPVRIRRLSFSSLLFKCCAQKYVAVQDLITEVRVQVQRKKRSYKRLSKGKAWINIIKRDQLHQRNLVPYNHQRSFFKSAAREGAWELQLSVDEIVERLQDLNINRESYANYRKSTMLARYNSRFQGKNANISSFDIINGEENALVPYRRNGTLVPFIKKKLPRPKVDLDAETNRVWNLLLENINNPGIDGSDEETARQWKNERNVFHERADLFIARMHLIQGDRRFSPWKGSVLDSVIGVFLTQNVSDHLSSSAFMSLAAKFPPKLISNGKSCDEKGADISNDRYESSVTNSGRSYVIISHPEDDIEDPVYSVLALENIGIQRPYGDSSNMSKPSDGELGRSEMSTNSSALEITEEPMIVKDETRSAIEVNISSQSSSDSLTQTFGRVGLPFDEIPVVNAELETRYQNSNHSIHPEVLENPVSKERCNSQTCEEVEREPEATLSDDRSQSKDDPWSLSRDFEVSEIPRNHQLHLTCDLGAENFEYIQNLETESAVLEESCAQLKEQASRRVDFTERAHGRPPACQGACMKSDIGSYSCLIQATSHNMEFPAIKGSGKHTLFHNDASRKKEADAQKAKTRRVGRNIDHAFDWDSLRKHAQENNKRENRANSMDSIDYEALRNANVNEIAKVIKKRGMNSMLAERIQDFVNGLVAKHGSTNLEWLRDVLPDQAKEYLLTVRGLGLKSVECVRLLTLHQHAFPVDTNVGRIAVRLGWVPLQPLPESLQLHLLEQYPVLESIQRHLWPRLCKLDQKTLYELHYQMITFGKVFCTKTKPNCNSCPMRGDCRHFASEFASSRLALPSPKDKRAIDRPGKSEASPLTHGREYSNMLQWFSPQQVADKHLDIIRPLGEELCEPIIEVPTSPEPIFEQMLDRDIEDIGINNASDFEDSDGIPVIKLNIAEFAQNLQNYVQQNMEIQEAELSKALVAFTKEAASIPARKLKNAGGLRTEHLVYVLPDSHSLLEKFDKREPDDPSPYLLAIWTPGETAKSIQLPETKCNQQHGKLCNEETCLSCNSVRESEFQIVRGTILIPCRTAMRGSFPLNGTYFQVNEVFADFHSSHNPLEVPRNLIWNLPTRTVFFGTSVPTIFRGMLTEHTQQCFWKGFICVRGFDTETRAPRPLAPRLHTAKSLLPRPKSGVNHDKAPRNARSTK